MKSIAINNGRVWDGDRFFSASVLIEEGRIAEVRESPFEAEFVLDGKGKIISPGLVDVHAHFCGITPDIYGATADGSSFPFGVTAAADAGAVKGNKELLEAISVRTVVFVCTDILRNRASFEKAEKLLNAYREAAVGLKVYFDTRFDGDNPKFCDTSPLKEICSYAHERGLKVMVHSNGSPVPMSDIISVLGTGDILTHSYHGGKNTVRDDGFACLFDAKKKGVIIDVGMAGNVHTDFGIFRDAIAAGAIPDTIGSDLTHISLFSRGGRYGLTMCMSIARYLGMSEEEIFRSVTSRAARALGRGNEWGTLTVGGRADLAVLDFGNAAFDLTDPAGNRIADKKGYRCIFTVLDGKIVWRDAL